MFWLPTLRFAESDRLPALALPMVTVPAVILAKSPELIPRVLAASAPLRRIRVPGSKGRSRTLALPALTGLLAVRSMLSAVRVIPAVPCTPPFKVMALSLPLEPAVKLSVLVPASTSALEISLFTERLPSTVEISMGLLPLVTPLAIVRPPALR